MWARSDESADRARISVEKLCGKLSGEVNAARVQITTEMDDLRGATFLVEAVAENRQVKGDVLAELAKLHELEDEDAVLASTTSSLSVAELAAASGAPERFAALHVFNPVPRMALVELCFPAEAGDAIRARTRDLCDALAKTAVEVPDMPGFVVNRLLFPYLFNAVELMVQTGMDPADIDRCMTLGAGHPMGPL